MTKQKIIKKVEDMMIQLNPSLSNPEFRKRLPIEEKMELVAKMLNLAEKLEFINSI